MTDTKPSPAERRIQELRDEIARLEREYGTGVRPSWVSTEIAIAQAHIRSYEK